FCWSDAFFETASGFSTTGATVIDGNLLLRSGRTLPHGVESLSYGLLFWRSLTQWIGGMGIVVLSLAILPLMNIGGQLLYNAEVSGIKSMESKIAPRIADAAKILWIVYVAMTLIQTVFLMFGGMGWFDALNHSMTTLATGGFSTKQMSLAHWDNTYIHWVMIVFMFLAGCNFALHYQFTRKKFFVYTKDEEFRFYVLIVLVSSIVITLSLYLAGNSSADKLNQIVYQKDLGGSIRTALFQVVSIITTSGFSTGDYAAWPGIAGAAVFTLMFISACGGSTSGGVKCVRILLIGKYAVSEIRRCLFPHLMQDIRISRTKCENATIQKTIGFCTMFVMLFFIFALLIAAATPGISLETAVSASITSLANVGPGFGDIGPTHSFSWMPAMTKIILGVEMLLGRLELYTLLVLLLSSFWKK
ncbi:MAG: TrkH family potassium uptake protein, partial [Lentisphaeria bacterium]|nr:TrkH family potassium uptake protein [Lentisphaeria bacterium]